MLVPFSPPPGINSDDTTFAAQGRWADGNNVRFVNGKPQVIGGQAAQFTISASNGTCTAILPFNRSGTITIGYGFASIGGTGATRLYVGTGLGAPSDRTPAGVPATTDNWALAAWGSTLLACPQGGTLYEQSGSSTATEVTQAPDEITYMLVTPERQVIALGCNEVGGTFNGLCIRGCDLEDYTEWTPTSDNNAFEHILDGTGTIVAARMVGPYLAVWTTAALYMGQFVGNPDQTYRFDRVEDNCGLAGPNAVIVVGQTAYWACRDLQIRAWAPGGPPTVVPCLVSRQFRNMVMDYAKYIVASQNARFNEIRFDYRSGASGYPVGNVISRYIAVCLTDAAWHTGLGGRSAIVEDGSLSSLTASLNDGPTILACMYDGSNNTFYLHETGTFSWGGGTQLSLAPYIRSADQYLDNSQRRMMIRSVQPDFEDQSGDAYLTINVRDRPQSNSTTKGPYTLATTTTKKDCRASGKIVSAKFGGDAGQPGSLFFRLGKPLFDVVPLGER